MLSFREAVKNTLSEMSVTHKTEMLLVLNKIKNQGEIYSGSSTPGKKKRRIKRKAQRKARKITRAHNK